MYKWGYEDELQTQDSSPLVTASLKQGAGRIVSILFMFWAIMGLAKAKRRIGRE
jgi:hypothetical protein